MEDGDATHCTRKCWRGEIVGFVCIAERTHTKHARPRTYRSAIVATATATDVLLLLLLLLLLLPPLLLLSSKMA